jgi:D-alanyl-D-alanine carboxypeptidase
MQALEAVSYLFTQARQNCPGTYVLNSGYRNLGQQEQLFNSAKDKSYVQEPAHSEHETGLAADLAVMNVKNVEKSAQSVYLRKNAWKYGLILRYPANKTNITGISDEPWHFRYVGKVHALYMVQNNLCLEEYIAKLQKIGSYSLKVDGKTYKVSSQKSVNGKLSLPKGAKYEISSDNIGNYILMSWD